MPAFSDQCPMTVSPSAATGQAGLQSLTATGSHRLLTCFLPQQQIIHTNTDGDKNGKETVNGEAETVFLNNQSFRKQPSVIYCFLKTWNGRMKRGEKSMCKLTENHIYGDEQSRYREEDDPYEETYPDGSVKHECWNSGKMKRDRTENTEDGEVWN